MRPSPLLVRGIFLETQPCLCWRQHPKIHIVELPKHARQEQSLSLLSSCHHCVVWVWLTDDTLSHWITILARNRIHYSWSVTLGVQVFRCCLVVLVDLKLVHMFWSARMRLTQSVDVGYTTVHLVLQVSVMKAIGKKQKSSMGNQWLWRPSDSTFLVFFWVGSGWFIVSDCLLISLTFKNLLRCPTALACRDFVEVHMAL